MSSPDFRGLAVFVTIVSELTGSVGAGVLLGYLLIRFANMPDWIMALTTLFGFVLGMWRVFKISKRFNNGSF